MYNIKTINISAYPFCTGAVCMSQHRLQSIDKIHRRQVSFVYCMYRVDVWFKQCYTIKTYKTCALKKVLYIVIHKLKVCQMICSDLTAFLIHMQTRVLRNCTVIGEKEEGSFKVGWAQFKLKCSLNPYQDKGSYKLKQAVQPYIEIRGAPTMHS